MPCSHLHSRNTYRGAVEEMTECPYCGKEYKTETWLQKHILNNHILILCPICEKLSPSDLHCVSCGYMFPDRKQKKKEAKKKNV